MDSLMLAAVRAAMPGAIPPSPHPLMCHRRLAYSRWLTDWVQRLDPKASDELLILARGKCVAWLATHVRLPTTLEVRQRGVAV